jgi:hypothetical protein
VAVTAVDYEDAESGQTTRTLYYLAEPPQVSVGSPGAGETVRGMVAPVSGSASPGPFASIAKVEVSANGGAPVTATLGAPAGPERTVAWSLPSLPTVPGTNQITVTATDTDGVQSTAQRTFKTALPLPVAAHQFLGRIGRDAGLSGGLGGSFSIKTTAAGAWTGTFVLGAARYSAKGVLEGGTNSYHRGVAEIARKGLPTLLVEFVLRGDDIVEGTISDGNMSEPLVGWRAVWNVKAGKAAGPLAGYFTAKLNPAPGQAYPDTRPVPGGAGYATVTVGADGKVRWAGQLGDGSKVSFSSILGPDGQLDFFLPLYKNTGSLSGAVTVAPSGGISGRCDWLKQAQVSTKERNYRGGFGTVSAPILVDLAGERYVDPGKGQPVLGLGGATPNLGLDFSGGGLEDSATDPDIACTVPGSNAPVFPKAGTAQNPASVKLTLNAAKGTFAGSFTLADPNPEKPGATIKRTAKFGGVLLPASDAGVGSFLLPQLAAPAGAPPTTATTSPILSGNVELVPVR